MISTGKALKIDVASTEDHTSFNKLTKETFGMADLVYTRVSTDEQSTLRQTYLLEEAGLGFVGEFKRQGIGDYYRRRRFSAGARVGEFRRHLVDGQLGVSRVAVDGCEANAQLGAQLAEAECLGDAA